MTRDQRRYQALQRLGCVACLIDGFGHEPADIHHIVDKGYRKHSGGNQATIPLCPWHHRGMPIIGLTAYYMASVKGPSMALSPRTFEDRYGSQRELLAKVNEMLADRLTGRTSGFEPENAGSSPALRTTAGEE